MYSLTKRMVDLIVVVGASPLWIPTMLVGILVVLVSSPGNPFYNSERVGMGGKSITVRKLRTMVPDADKLGSGATSTNDPRLIAGANILRQLKIDEIPQLLSVLTGEMSLVGPRPELQQYVALYSQEEKDKILSVKPGLVDFAVLKFVDMQLHLENSTQDAETYFLENISAEKISLRVYYAENRSFGTDLYILVMTPVCVTKALFVRLSRRWGRG